MFPLRAQALCPALWGRPPGHAFSRTARNVDIAGNCLIFALHVEGLMHGIFLRHITFKIPLRCKRLNEFGTKFLKQLITWTRDSR
jgi:hypothetical protein